MKTQLSDQLAMNWIGFHCFSFIWAVQLKGVPLDQPCSPRALPLAALGHPSAQRLPNVTTSAALRMCKEYRNTLETAMSNSRRSAPWGRGGAHLVVSFGLTWIHLYSLGLIWIHLDSLGLAWIHLDSPGLTWTHLDSLGFTWTHLDSLGLTGVHLDSLGFTGTHLDSLGLTCRFHVVFMMDGINSIVV